MSDNQPWEFTCITCGGQHLTVTRIWEILAGPDSERWQEWGMLKGDHLWQFKFKEIIQAAKVQENGVARWNFDAYTKDNSSSKPEEYEIHDPESNPGNDKFYVNCSSCDREIEFGWSFPDRGGGIFPVECSDFLPGKFWPEPRYLDSWQQKGWLQKDPAFDETQAQDS